MAENKEPKLPALSEFQIRALIVGMRKYLRARYHFVVDHDDLIQQTLADLYALGLEWTEGSELQEQATRLAFTILKRRIADHYRANARDIALSMLAVEEQLAPSTEAVAMYRQRLALVLTFMADLSTADRMLLLRGADGVGGAAVPPAARKKLSRLRAHLREMLDVEPEEPDRSGRDNDG